MSLMGVDVGTTGVKAAVFDENGSLLATAYEEYPLAFPFPGASELDSRGVIEAACRVIGQAAGDLKTADPVRAIGIASQGEAFTPLDSSGRPLANAMTSSDSRAADYVTRFGGEFGFERLYRITGHTAYPIYSLFKLLWLKECRPDAWRSAWKLLFFEDLIAYVLTGETKTDYTMAARSMLFDIAAKTWSGEILDRIGLEPERLPEPVASGAPVGTLGPEMAGRLGLGPGVTVAVCGHDQPVGALGCAAAGAGRAAYSIGTVECITPAADRLILSPELMKANLATYPHVVPDTYTTVAFNITGGSVLKWVRDNLATEEAAEARREGEDPYDRIIAAASDRPAKLVLVPHFGPTGTPHFDSNGTGVLFGLNLTTTRPEILRSVLEGITYEMRWNLAILGEAGFEVSELRAIGGGAKSETWMQIKADILGIPLTTMRVAEATCMGAAILAWSGIQRLDPREISSRWAEPIREFAPRSEFASAYSDRFAIYRQLYDSLGAARAALASLKGE